MLLRSATHQPIRRGRECIVVAGGPDARNDGTVRPPSGEVLHFSEDPTITTFAPHIAPTAREPTAYVWAVDGARAPAYWFPRQCPRAMAWATETSTADESDRIIGRGDERRVHAVEYRWLDPIRTAELFAYRLPASPYTRRTP